MKALIVVDMQNDFIDGALGTPEALSIVPFVREKVMHFAGLVIFKRDTHFENYLSTREGKNLPVPHCIKGTQGWEIADSLKELTKGRIVIDKPTFGSTELQNLLVNEHEKTPFEEIELVGLCTDICVISNAMLIKAALPEVNVTVDSSCCAGVTPESHENALSAMKMCQITVK